MNIKVCYHSATGNTKKIADAIADVLGTKATSVDSENISEPVDFLFIGAAVYSTPGVKYGDIHPSIKKFISNLDSKKVKEAVVFCTGFQEKANNLMKDLLENQGIKVSDKKFMCKGKFLTIFNYGHPNDRDIEDAKTFARNIINDRK